jgi:hypothetical protein
MCFPTKMEKWHHFHSPSDSEVQNMGPTWPTEWDKGAPICPWDSIPKAQMLCIYLIWMREVIWGGCQPQTWRIGIIFTPQVMQNSKPFGANLASGMVWGCTHIPLRQHTKGSNTLDILHEIGNWSEVDVSLKHDVVASFFSLLVNWPRIPKSVAHLGQWNGIRVHSYTVETA